MFQIKVERYARKHVEYEYFKLNGDSVYSFTQMVNVRIYSHPYFPSFHTSIGMKKDVTQLMAHDWSSYLQQKPKVAY